ncbi:MAG: secretin N-terminal domain-containing protein [Spirochaetia bacterium]
MASSAGLFARPDLPEKTRPGIEAVSYRGDTVTVAGERLLHWRVKWNQSQTQLTLRVPRARKPSAELVPSGSSDLIEAVEITTVSREEELSFWQRLRGEAPSDVLVTVSLRRPSYQHSSVSADASTLTIAFEPIDASAAPNGAGEQQQEEEPRGGYATIGLRYANAEGLASMLRRLVQRGDRAVQVMPRRNQLIIDREIERFDDIEALVRRLDHPGDQILIDAQIVEINTDAASQLGLDLGSSITLSLEEDAGFSNTVPLPLQTFLRSPLEISATLDMLKGEGEAQVLANPRVSTVDGVPAVMQTEERFPILVTQSSGDQTYQTKQDIVGGIELSITPRHNGDGEITTEIHTDVTTITGTTKEGYPTTSGREVETTIRVRSG